MSTAALTAKYRPQTFAEVAGQDTLKAILSRAALEGRVAPAYLFSGTRGVGKTTLARIFAKALNCRTAPTAEPCNACDICKAVTLGNAVDVVEMDGASNRGIDDVRRLREDVGYAPMDGKFKVFIIDEAHMLSREAFNALLKTLEEPPANVTFIMATTEPHKFPATIISRCQHFVFKRLPERNLEAHLAGVLAREKISFDERAIRLIARRGAGSVRDSMSLLGQVLALGGGTLTEEATRGVLGLAGQEVLAHLVTLLGRGETLPVIALLRELLDQGLDLGFFLRELGGLWRNMFILKQSGEAGLAAIDLPLEESRLLLDICAEFSLTHIHACWQMTLEGQRRVLTSLEPGLALELLLLNIAMLPQLISLDAVSSLVRRTPPQGTRPVSPPTHAPATSPSRAGYPHPSSGVASARPIPPPSSPMPTPGREREMEQATAASGTRAPSSGEGSSLAGEAAPDPLPAPEALSGQAEKPADTGADTPSPSSTHATPPTAHVSEPVTPVSVQNASSDADAQAHETLPPDTFFAPPATDEDAYAPVDPEGMAQADTSFSSTPQGERPQNESPSLGPDNSAPEPTPHTAPLPSWEAIVAHVVDIGASPVFSALAAAVRGTWREGTLVLESSNAFAGEQFSSGSARQTLEQVLNTLVGRVPELSILMADTQNESRDVVLERITSNPGVQRLESLFGARIMDFGQIRK